MHINHEEYYLDRLTESDLCYDFPGDEILIDGLHAMQLHLWSNNVQVDIPVVRVMNAAHFLAAYMFATTCSGDRMEYDTLAYSSVGHDQRLVLVTMVVLAAMLSRTEGFRARNCRNLIISDRGADFEEGLTLYERFLRSAERRFAEEDFLIDTHTQIQRLTAENERLTSENIQLKYTLTNMENQQNSQYNNCVIYMAPVYSTTYNTNNYGSPHIQDAEITEPVQESPCETDLFKYIHVSVTDEAERLSIHQTVANIVRLPRMQQICDELYKLMKKSKVLCSITPEAMLAELRRMGLPSADVNGFSDKNFYHYYKTPKLS